jgi:hypothetical protein
MGVIGLHPTGAWPVSGSQAEACKHCGDWLAADMDCVCMCSVPCAEMKKACTGIALARNGPHFRFRGAWPSLSLAQVDVQPSNHTKVVCRGSGWGSWRLPTHAIC